MSAVAVKPLRWSSARDCGRKAVFEAEAAPARERYAQEEKILYRGRTLGREYITMLATASQKRVWVSSGPRYWLPPELRAASEETAEILAEVPIQWGLGTGHADAYVKQTKTIVEVLSSAHASEAAIQSKLLQAVGYAEHYPEAESIALVVLNPTDFSEERYAVVKESQAYLDLYEKMEARIAELEGWRDQGTLPGRVCAKPSEARGHFCLFAEHCFAGWEPPPLERVVADESLIAAAVDFHEAKRARAELARDDKALEVKQKEAQAVLEAAELPEEAQVGHLKVSRTDVQRKPTFQWERAEAAGKFEPGLYGEFFREGASYSTWKVDAIAGETEDFGDEAPW